MVSIETLRGVINKPVAEITEQDKSAIREVAKQEGVNLPRKRACASCWVDCAFECLKRLQAKENAVKTGYTLREGVDILFNGERVNSATITDARAMRWIASGLSTEYFV